MLEVNDSCKNGFYIVLFNYDELPSTSKIAGHELLLKEFDDAKLLLRQKFLGTVGRLLMAKKCKCGKQGELVLITDPCAKEYSTMNYEEALGVVKSIKNECDIEIYKFDECTFFGINETQRMVDKICSKKIGDKLIEIYDAKKDICRIVFNWGDN